MALAASLALHAQAVDNPAEENVFKQLRLNMWVSYYSRDGFEFEFD